LAGNTTCFLASERLRCRRAIAGGKNIVQPSACNFIHTSTQSAPSAASTVAPGHETTAPFSSPAFGASQIPHFPAGSGYPDLLRIFHKLLLVAGGPPDEATCSKFCILSAWRLASPLRLFPNRPWSGTEWDRLVKVMHALHGMGSAATALAPSLVAGANRWPWPILPPLPTAQDGLRTIPFDERRTPFFAEGAWESGAHNAAAACLPVDVSGGPSWRRISLSSRRSRASLPGIVLPYHKKNPQHIRLCPESSPPSRCRDLRRCIFRLETPTQQKADASKRGERPPSSRPGSRSRLQQHHFSTRGPA